MLWRVAQPPASTKFQLCHQLVDQVAGLMVLDRAAEIRPQGRLAMGATCAGVTLLLQIVVRQKAARSESGASCRRLQSGPFRPPPRLDTSMHLSCSLTHWTTQGLQASLHRSCAGCLLHGGTISIAADLQ